MVSKAIILLCLLGGVLSDFQLHILHTNDVHSRVEEMNKYGGTCTETQKRSKQCFGGVARRHTIVKQVRSEEDNVLLLDGGDQYQGTLWFNEYKGRAAVKFMNNDKFDAMALGNHEFDSGVKGIVPFIRNASFPILSANLDPSKEPLWKNVPMFKKSTVLTRSGVKIGVVGYITPETSWLSSPGPNIRFKPVISSIREEARKLKAQGVKILIGLGHAGIEVDREIAKEIEELDVIVGGHTNTFLYNGPSPSNEKSQGSYPLVFDHTDGTKALVVQDYAYGKYIGHLKVTFDDDGKVKSWSGNPILLNETIRQDPVVLAKVRAMQGAVLESRNTSLGKTYVHLSGSKAHCRNRDCNLGNLIADAVVKMSQKTPDDGKWATVALSVWNAGGIRASINKERDEPITREDVYTVLPFGNTAEIAVIVGRVLRQAFEHSVARVDGLRGQFLQVSGFRVRYSKQRPVGSRIMQVKALSLDGQLPMYEELNDSRIYRVIAPSYILGGGDGFSMLQNVTRHPGEDVAALLERYIAEESPITTAFEDRILAVKEQQCETSSSVRNACIPILLYFICIFLYFF